MGDMQNPSLFLTLKIFGYGVPPCCNCVWHYRCQEQQNRNCFKGYQLAALAGWNEMQRLKEKKQQSDFLMQSLKPLYQLNVCLFVWMAAAKTTVT